MSVLEIEAPTRLRRPDVPAREAAVAVTPAMLGLSSKPGFLSAEDAAPVRRSLVAPTLVAPDRPTLWDRLRLAWAEPQTTRDLVGE